jgi:hypothetical protein
MRTLRYAAVVAAAALSGCTTLSFAPPAVETRYAGEKVESNCAVTASAKRTEIHPDVPGALQLTDNFLEGYRCAAREASDGRQSFEIPSFLALVAAGLGGPLYGLTENEQLAGAGYSAVMMRANSYYAPKEKANVLRSAIDGVLCIKNASVGYDYFDENAGGSGDQQELLASTSDEEKIIELIDEQLADLKARLKPGISAAEKSEIEAKEKELNDLKTAMIKSMAQKVTKASVRIDAARAYYELVASALFSVDRVLGQRLSDSGSFDPASLSGELENLTRKEVTAENDAKALRDSAKTNFLSATNLAEQQVDVELDALQARLQKCVVRAKMT